jgi:chemotaxis protein MotB
VSRRRLVEEQVSHDRWLVSYADFVTLLFAFFVVMYSISQVNEGKYKVLSETLTQVFSAKDNVELLKQPDSVLDPMLDPIIERSPDPFQVEDIAKSNPLNVKNSEPAGTDSQHSLDSQNKGAMLALSLPTTFQKINNTLDQSFGQLMEDDLLTVRGNEEWLELELKSSLLFPSGDDSLGSEAIELLGSIAEVLRDKENPIRVEGFTDNVPINSAQFPSNWELSSFRAAAVVKLFVEEGLSPERLAAVGYGEFQPIADNITSEGRVANRRVVLMISNNNQLRPDLRELTTTAALDAAQADVDTEAETDQGGNQGIDIIIPGVNDTTQSTELAPAIDGVRTIELDGGGLLFTNGDLREGEVENPAGSNTDSEATATDQSTIEQ